uniref:Uncharacterized protein n=1 Tax=Anopheles atroparvus TaxID=41427 RepID=A0A182ISB9_ANOAO
MGQATTTANTATKGRVVHRGLLLMLSGSVMLCGLRRKMHSRLELEPTTPAPGGITICSSACSVVLTPPPGPLTTLPPELEAVRLLLWRTGSVATAATSRSGGTASTATRNAGHGRPMRHRVLLLRPERPAESVQSGRGRIRLLRTRMHHSRVLSLLLLLH